MKESVRSVLTRGFTEPIRDTLWGHIYLTPPIAALTRSAPFMRLFRIFQLGPVYHVYPGATHTRASHSLGVYHLGRRLLENLVDRGAEDWTSPQGVLSFLCACLLHDLGHFPYAHSLKELALKAHEKLTGEVILAEPLRSLIAAAGADPGFTAAIVDTSLPETGKELHFYRKLLSGVLDPDKLDYLNRDARFCGVPYGAQDVDFILSRLYPHGDRGVDIDSRGIPSVESILFSKYLMYRTVYWHRQVRSATAMIKKALSGLLESGNADSGQLYDLDDQSLFAMIKSPLAEAVREGRLYGAAAEFPWDGKRHGPLAGIAFRSGREEELTSALGKAGVPLKEGELIIDIPEPVSFETGLFVRDEGKYFAESSSAFSGETVQAFVRSLYTVRIFVPPLHEEKIRALHGVLEDILETPLHKSEKRLH